MANFKLNKLLSQPVSWEERKAMGSNSNEDREFVKAVYGELSEEDQLYLFDRLRAVDLNKISLNEFKNKAWKDFYEQSCNAEGDTLGKFLDRFSKLGLKDMSSIAKKQYIDTLDEPVLRARRFGSENKVDRR